VVKTKPQSHMFTLITVSNVKMKLIWFKGSTKVF